MTNNGNVVTTALAPPQPGESEQERVMKGILDQLDQLGGMSVSEDQVTYQGNRIVLPEVAEGNLGAIITYLKELEKAQEKVVAFHRTFACRPWDGAAAFQRTMQRLFGTTGIGKDTKHPITGKKIPPHMIDIDVDYGTQTQVPWGHVGLSLLNAVFQLDITWDDNGPCFQLHVHVPKKHARRVEGFFRILQDELDHRSIYRGRAIDASEHPGFLNPDAVSRDRVVYARDVQMRLERDVWGPIRYAAALRADGIPLKRAVLLSGPYGSGKSLAGALTAQVCREHGWTYILVRADDDPFQALQTAKLLAPAVTHIEDLDLLTAGKTRKELAKLLDALDSVSTKGAEVMALFTTNFAGDIDKGVMRPGRIDSHIVIDTLDQDGYEQLVKVLVRPARLAADISYASVAEAFSEFTPAFAAEAVNTACRIGLVRSGGRPVPVTTEDLVTAAADLRAQKALMDDASEAARTRSTMDEVLTREVTGILNRTRFMGRNLEVAEEGDSDS